MSLIIPSDRMMDYVSYMADVDQIVQDCVGVSIHDAWANGQYAINGADVHAAVASVEAYNDDIMVEDVAYEYIVAYCITVLHLSYKAADGRAMRAIRSAF